MRIVLALCILLYRLWFRTRPVLSYADSRLYLSRRRVGYWEIQYSSGQKSISYWNQYYWISNNRRDLRPMKVQRWISQ